MNYEMNIHTFWQFFDFVHGFNSEQRFHQTHHRLTMLQRHARCSSVQRQPTMRGHLIKNAYFRGKKWCLVFNILFGVSNIVWPCCTLLYLQNVFLSQVWSTCMFISDLSQSHHHASLPNHPSLKNWCHLCS